MADLTGILRQTFTVSAQSIKTIDFKDKQPNYFHIQNIGAGVIYFSVHGMPTAAYYDMKIDGGSIGTFTDTYQQPEAYIYNPSTEDVNVIMLSFSAPFDPAVLAQANKQITIGGTIETDGVVKGFQTALPTGSNKIGNVGISGALPTGSNKIGKVEMTGTEFTNLAAKVSEIRTKLDSLSFDIGAVTVDEVSIKDDGVQGYIYCNTFNGNSITLTPPDGYYFSKICYITTSADINLTLNPCDNTPKIHDPFTLNSNIISNMKCKVKSLRLEELSFQNASVTLFAEIKPYKVTTETLTITDWAQLKNGDKIVTASNGSVSVTSIKLNCSNASTGEYKTDTMTVPGIFRMDDGWTLGMVMAGDNSGPIISLTIERNVYSC